MIDNSLLMIFIIKKLTVLYHFFFITLDFKAFTLLVIVEVFFFLDSLVGTLSSSSSLFLVF